MTDKLDKKFISYALNLAKKNLGLTAPNPVVGCVIVKNNIIIATGVTAKTGRPHGEEIAINKALAKENGKALLNGATLYVTLEPCAHFGKTPPCVHKIIDNNITRVVIATQDPDHRVNGQGIKKLQDHGIDVSCGILEKEAQQLNQGFFKVKRTGLPYITLKLATSLDGKIATKDGHSQWITSPKAREFGHHLRAINDAIMIGANTAKRDNPTLTCRLSGLEEFSPQRIIISKNADLDPRLKIFEMAQDIPTFIITNNANATFSHCTMIVEDIKNGHIALTSALQNIAKIGINSILVEGGSNLATQLIQANLVDELVWIRNKKIIGGDGMNAIGNLGFNTIEAVINYFHKEQLFNMPDDIIEIYRKDISKLL